MRRTGVPPILLVSLVFLAVNHLRGLDHVELGKEVIASTSSEGGKLKCEPSAAMTDEAIIITWNDSYGGMNGCGAVGTVVGWSISRDAGKSFAFGGFLPVVAGQATSCAADSWVRADENGDFHLTILAIQSGRNEVQCYRMEKSALGKWKRLPDPAVATTSSNEGLDRSSMATGENGTIGVAYTHLVPAHNYLIDFVVSLDHGDSWSIPITVSDTAKKSRLCATVGIRRDTVWVVWLEGSSYTLNELWWTVSVNSGKTFERPQLLYRLSNTSAITADGYNMSNGLGPVILVDPPSLIATRRSTLLAWIEPAENGNRILQWTFEPKKNIWTEPRDFGQSSSDWKAFAATALTAKSEAVLYYDRRDGSGTSMTDVYLTLKRNGASQDIKLNGVPTDWKATRGDSLNAPFQRVFGDYITLTSWGNSYLATWTDGRTGSTAIYSRMIKVK